jgi:hypothetical protein
MRCKVGWSVCRFRIAITRIPYLISSLGPVTPHPPMPMGPASETLGVIKGILIGLGIRNYKA